MNSRSKAPAVVVGLCAHGLGLVRDLARTGVRVIALEQDRSLPGVHTRHANVRYVSDINSDALVDTLCEIAESLFPRARPILFLTNDRMVEVVGKQATLVQQYYRLSWAGCVTNLLPLLSKENIEARCAETGLNYPKARVAHGLADVIMSVDALRLPVIIKPTRPLSRFKTLVLQSLGEIHDARQVLEGSFPVLVQEFIPGDDEQIQFGALYLEHGRTLAHFEGRKLHSRPMGHTTIAIPEPSSAVFELAERFFSGLDLSGPVSLELKRDRDGAFWVIEPTVGRTDFWAGLCSANGVSLPLVEYLSLTGESWEGRAQGKSHLWGNGERFPWVLPWLLRHRPGALLRYRVRGVYFDLRDPVPYVKSLARTTARMAARLRGRPIR